MVMYTFCLVWVLCEYAEFLKNPACLYNFIILWCYISEVSTLLLLLLRPDQPSCGLDFWVSA